MSRKYILTIIIISALTTIIYQLGYYVGHKRGLSRAGAIAFEALKDICVEVKRSKPDESKNWVTLPYVIEEVETNTFEVINGDGSTIVHTNLIMLCSHGGAHD